MGKSGQPYRWGCYSINDADGHFNDILRCYPDRRIDVVVSETTAPEFAARMEKVFGISANQRNKVQINGQEALQVQKVRLIAAEASDVNLGALFGVKGFGPWSEFALEERSSQVGRFRPRRPALPGERSLCRQQGAIAFDLVFRPLAGCAFTHGPFDGRCEWGNGRPAPVTMVRLSLVGRDGENRGVVLVNAARDRPQAFKNHINHQEVRFLGGFVFSCRTTICACTSVFAMLGPRSMSPRPCRIAPPFVPSVRRPGRDR